MPAQTKRTGQSEKRYWEHPEPAMATGSDEPIEREPYMLPILYAVWPVEIPLPTGADYEILYEVYLPKGKMRPATPTTADDVLRSEAVMLAYGGGFPLDPITVCRPRGTIKVWDDYANAYGPCAGLKIFVQDGSYTDDYYCDDTGYWESDVYWPEASMVEAITEKEGLWELRQNNTSYLWTIVMFHAGFWDGRTINIETDLILSLNTALHYWFSHNLSLTKTLKKEIIVRFKPDTIEPGISGYFWQR